MHELRATAIEVFRKVQRDQLTDRAGAMTYQSLMAFFPALLLGVSLLGLIGQGSLYADMIEQVRDVAPPELVQPIQDLLASAASTSSDTAITALVIALLLGLNGASGALAAAGKGINVVLGVKEDRGFVHRKVHDIGWTLLLIVLVSIAFGLVLLGGGLAEWVFDRLGLGGLALTVWSIVRWPLAVLVVMLVYAIVYKVAPDADERRFRFITPGAVIGVLAWLVASGAFFLYVTQFSSYNRTYGAFATAVVLLIWLWISNLALLMGAEINAVLDERRCGVSHAPEGAQVARQRADAGADAPQMPAAEHARPEPSAGRLVARILALVLAAVFVVRARRHRDAAL